MLTRVCFLCFVAFSLSAQVQIRDTISTPFSGVRFSGTVTISGPAMTTTDGRTIARWTRAYSVTNGVFAADLEPNDTSLPAGTSYAVRYAPTVGLKIDPWSEVWVVPTSGSPLKVNAVRVAVAPSPGVLIQLQQLAASGATNGQVATWNGTAWTPATPGGVSTGGGPRMHRTTFTGQTSVTVTAASHGITDRALAVHCYDASGNAIDGEVSVNQGTLTVTATFATSQDGSIVITGGGYNGAAAFQQSFTAQTFVSVPAATHKMAPGLVAQIIDASGERLDGEVQVSASGDISVAFAVAQTGTLLASGPSGSARKPFTAQTSVSFLASEHQLGPSLFVQAFDASGNLLDASVTIDPATLAVSVAFAVAQTGYLTIIAR